MAFQSKIVLSSINIPGNHSFAFANNAARDSWFDAKTKLTFDDLYYVRPEGIQIDSRLENLLAYNFGYYFNEIGARIYFRVLEHVYIGEKNTRLRIEKDVLMTYLPSCSLDASFIERSNEAPTSIYDSDIPEIEYHGGFIHTLLDTFSTPQEHSFFMQLSGDEEPEGQSVTTTLYKPKNFNNTNATELVYASMFRVFVGDATGGGECADVISGYMEKGTADRIIAAGTVPTADVSYDENVEPPDTGLDLPGQMNAYVTAVRQTKTVSVSTALSNRIAKDNVTVVIAEIDNFANQIEIPISELSGGSLQLVSVSDPISQQRHIGVLSGADGDNELKYRLTLNVGTSLPSVNLPYYMAVRNIETDLGAQQTNNLVSGASTIGQGAVAGAAVGAIAGGVGAVPGAVIGGIGGVLATGVSALNNKTSADAALEKAKRMAPTVSGIASGFGVFANRAIGVNVFIKEPGGSGLSQLQDYYRFFGYTKSRILTPNVKSGTKFYKGNVNGSFPGSTVADAAIIRTLFNDGVWIWANEASEFDY